MARALRVGRSDQGDLTLGVDDRDRRLRRAESRDGRAGIRQRDGITWPALRREPLPRLRGYPRFSGPTGDGTLRGPGGSDPDPPAPGIVRKPRGAGQERPPGHQGTGLEVQGAKRLADVPELPPVPLPVVFGGRRGPFSVVCAGAVGGRGSALQRGLFFAGAFGRRELPASL